MVDVGEDRNECPVQLQVPLGWPVIGVHAHLEHAVLTAESKVLLPCLGVVVKMGPIHLGALHRSLGHCSSFDSGGRLRLGISLHMKRKNRGKRPHGARKLKKESAPPPPPRSPPPRSRSPASG